MDKFSLYLHKLIEKLQDELEAFDEDNVSIEVQTKRAILYHYKMILNKYVLFKLQNDIGL